MTNSKLDDSKSAALSIPHNITIADTVIDVKVTGFSSTVTLGFINPSGVLQPGVTLLMPTDKMHGMANEILDKIKENSDSIKAQHKKLSDQISKK